MVNLDALEHWLNFKGFELLSAEELAAELARSFVIEWREEWKLENKLQRSWEGGRWDCWLCESKTKHTKDSCWSWFEYEGGL